MSLLLYLLALLGALVLVNVLLVRRIARERRDDRGRGPSHRDGPVT